MRIVSAIVMWGLVSAAAHAQVPVEHQPDLGALQTELKQARDKRPRDTRAFLAVKQGRIEATLAEDLKKFDWYRAGSWSYPEKKFDVWYERDTVSQYDFFRYRDDGAELSFLLVTDQVGKGPASQVLHQNFKDPPPTFASVKKIGEQTYLERVAYGEKEVHRVVSYEKGVLVLDLSFDGKPASKTVKFRDVLVAFPRLFESTGK